MKSTPQLSLLVAPGAGALSFLSPCVLPLVPSYLSFITGMSYIELRDHALLRQRRRRIMLYAVCFIAGFSVIFVALGASLNLLGRFLNTSLPLLMRTVHLQVRHTPVGYLGAFLVGVSFTVAWTPCVGPILGSILLLASTAAEVHRGSVLLTAYSLGLAMPAAFVHTLCTMFLAHLTTEHCSPAVTPLLRDHAGGSGVSIRGPKALYFHSIAARMARRDWPSACIVITSRVMRRPRDHVTPWLVKRRRPSGSRWAT